MASLSRFERKVLKTRLEQAGIRVSLRPGETGTQALARASQRLLTSKDAKVVQAREAVADDQKLQQAAAARVTPISSARAESLLRKSQAEAKARDPSIRITKTKAQLAVEQAEKKPSLNQTLTQTIERKQTRDTGLARRQLESTRQRITEPGFDTGSKLSQQETFFRGFGFGKGPAIKDTRVSQRDIGFGEQLVKRARELEGKKVRIVPGTSLVKEFGPIDSKIQAFGTLLTEKAQSFSKRVSRSEPVAAVTQSETFQKFFKPRQTVKETEVTVGRGGRATIATTKVVKEIKGTGGIITEAGGKLSDLLTTASKATGTPFKEVIKGNITGPSISERAFKVARQNVARGETLLGFAQAGVGGVAREIETKPLKAVVEFGAGFAIGGGAGVLAKGTSAVKGASRISNVFQGVFLGGTVLKVGATTVTKGVVAGGAEFGSITKSLAAFGVGTQLGFKSAIKLKTSARSQFVTEGKIVRPPKKSTKIFGAGRGTIGSERVGFKIAGQGRRTFTRGIFKKAGVGFRTFTKGKITQFKIFDPKTGRLIKAGTVPKAANIPGRGTGQVQIGKQFFKTLSGKLKTQTFATRTKQTKELFFRFDPKAKTGVGSFTIKSTTKPKFDIVRDIKLGIKLPQRVLVGATEAGSFGNVGSPIRTPSGLRGPAATVKVDPFLAGSTRGAVLNVKALSRQVASVTTPKLFTPVLTGGVSKPLATSEVISGATAFAEPFTGAKSSTLDTAASQFISQSTSTSETSTSAGTSGSVARSIFKSTPRGTPGIKTPQVRLPTPPIPTPQLTLPPFIPIDLLGGFQSTFRSGKVFRGRQARAKSPSLFAAGFGIKGKRQRGGAATGLGLRLLQPKKKKKGFGFGINI